MTSDVMTAVQIDDLSRLIQHSPGPFAEGCLLRGLLERLIDLDPAALARENDFLPYRAPALPCFPCAPLLLFMRLHWCSIAISECAARLGARRGEGRDKALVGRGSADVLVCLTVGYRSQESVRQQTVRFSPG